MRLLVIASGPSDCCSSSRVQRALAGCGPSGRYGREAPALAVLWDLRAYAAPEVGREPCSSGFEHYVEAANTGINWERVLADVDSRRQPAAGGGDGRSSPAAAWFVVTSHTAVEGRALLDQADRVLYLCAPEETVFDDCIRNMCHRMCYEECLWPNHYRRSKAFLGTLQQDEKLRRNTLLLQSSALAESAQLLDLVLKWLSSDDPSDNFPTQHAVTPEMALAKLTEVGPSPPQRMLDDELSIRHRTFHRAGAECEHSIQCILQNVADAEDVSSRRESIAKLQELILIEIKSMPAIVCKLYQTHLRGNAAGQLAQFAKDALDRLSTRTASGAPLLKGEEQEDLIVDIADCADALFSLGHHWFERHNMWKKWGGIFFPLIVGMMQSPSATVACKGLIFAEQVLCADFQRYGLRFQEEDKRLSDTTTARVILDAILRLLGPAGQPLPEPDAEQLPGSCGKEQALAYLENLEALCSIRRTYNHKPPKKLLEKLPRALSLLLRGSPYHCRLVPIASLQKLIDTAAHLTKVLNKPSLASEILGSVSQLLSYGHPAISSFIAANEELVGVAAECFRQLCTPQSDDSHVLAYDLLGKLARAKRQAQKHRDVEGSSGREGEEHTGPDGQHGTPEPPPSAAGRAVGGSRLSSSHASDGEGAKGEEAMEDVHLSSTTPSQAACAGTKADSALGASEMLQRFFRTQALRHNLDRGRATQRLRDRTEAARAGDWQRLEAEEAQLENQHLRRELQGLQQQRDRLAAEVEEGRREQDELTRKVEDLSRTCEELRARLSAKQLTSVASGASNQTAGPRPRDPLQETLGSPGTFPVSSHPLCGVHDPFDVGIDQAREFVEAVRSEREGLCVMRKSICGSLKHLGADLYSSPAHFLHELIQNAEDNEYSASCCPVLEVTLRPDSILITNNERGFRPRDVLSLCSVAESGKIAGVHIGQKGLGFKSVFSCTDSPHVLSGPWRFKFQLPGEDEMSYITPLWIDGTTADPQQPPLPSDLQALAQSPAHIPKTHIYLPLKDALRGSPEFMQSMRAMLDPAVLSVVLINMRHLRRFVVCQHSSDATGVDKATVMEKTDGAGQTGVGPVEALVASAGLLGNSAPEVESITDRMATLSVTCGSTGPQQSVFRVFLCTVWVPTHVRMDSSSRDTDTTRIKLAFPMAEAEENKEPPRFPVYAGLPVMDLGFPFALDCDWVLVTSRESVRDCVWNRFLRDASASLLVTLLVTDPQLRERFVSFLPHHSPEAGPWWGRFYESTRCLVEDKLQLLMRGNDSDTAPLRYRLASPALAGLVDSAVLKELAGIQLVMGSDANPLQGILPPLSLADILESLPDGWTPTTPDTQKFLNWVLGRPGSWFRLFFEALLAESSQAPELLDLCRRKPIFSRRPAIHQTPADGSSYCSLDPCLPEVAACEGAAVPPPLVVHCSDSRLRMWRPEIIVIDARSDAEQRLLKMLLLPELEPQLLVKILAKLHLHSPIEHWAGEASGRAGVIWQDLCYLRDHWSDHLRGEIDVTEGWLAIPTRSGRVTRAAEVMVPTLLGVPLPQRLPDATAAVAPHLTSIAQSECSDPFLDQLKWELFLLSVGCQGPQLADTATAPSLALPSLARFSAEEAQLAVSILQRQSSQALAFMRSLPVLTLQGDLIRVGEVCDEACFRGQLLPTITVPPHCKELAEMLQVTVAPSVELVVNGLRLLKVRRHSQVDAYQRWLIHLQDILSVQQLGADGGLGSFNPLEDIHLFLPDQTEPKAWVKLGDILCLGRSRGPGLDDNANSSVDTDDHEDSLAVVCQTLDMAIVSQKSNVAYTPFIPLLVRLGCKTLPSIPQVVQALDAVTCSPSYYQAIGLSCSLLTEPGVATVMGMYRLLESMLRSEYAHLLIGGCRKEPGQRVDLCWRLELLDTVPRLDLSGQGSEVEPGRAGSPGGAAARNSEDGAFGVVANFAFMLPDTRVIRSWEVVACAEPSLLDAVLHVDSTTPFLHPELVLSCPLLMAALRVPYLEHRIVMRFKHESKNAERLLPRMSRAFSEALGHPGVQVVTMGYFIIDMLGSHADEVVSMDNLRPDQDYKTIRIQMDLPFVVLRREGRDLVACATKFLKHVDTNRPDKASQLAVFVSALARMLEVRQGLSTAEAVQRAREAVHVHDLELHQTEYWEGASGHATVLPVQDMLFPHRDTAFIRQQLTMAGVQDIDEVAQSVQQPEGAGQPRSSSRPEPEGSGPAGHGRGQICPLPGSSHVVSSHRARDDTLFRARAKQLLDENSGAEAGAGLISGFGLAGSGVWILPGPNDGAEEGQARNGGGLLEISELRAGRKANNIVDTEQQKATGVRAEHFMYLYLTSVYGAHFQPYQHWKSSARLAVLPGQRHKVDDGAGYDFEVDDVKHHFEGFQDPRSRRTNTRALQCFIEVKGCAGAWDGSCNISRNEKRKMGDVAAGLYGCACYLVVVVEFADDPVRTRLAAVINWSLNQYAFSLEPQAFEAVLSRGAGPTRHQQAAEGPGTGSAAAPPRHQGIVEKVIRRPQDTFGFIQVTSNTDGLRAGTSVYVHQSELQNDLVQGLAVTFWLGSNKRGPFARNVREDAAAPHSSPSRSSGGRSFGSRQRSDTYSDQRASRSGRWS